MLVHILLCLWLNCVCIVGSLSNPNISIGEFKFWLRVWRRVVFLVCGPVSLTLFLPTLFCKSPWVFYPLLFCITMLLIPDYLVVTCLLLCTSKQLRSLHFLSPLTALSVLLPRKHVKGGVVTLFWSRVINTFFTYIVWQKGYFHPFPLSVGILSPLILQFRKTTVISNLHRCFKYFKKNISSQPHTPDFN